MAANGHDDVSFGSWLREQRRSKGLTQQELADLLGMTRQAVLEWEADRVKPTPANRKAVDAALRKAGRGPGGGAPSGGSRDDLRDDLMYWRGRVDEMRNSVRGVGQTITGMASSLDALGAMLAKASDSMDGLADSGVLPAPRGKGRWTYVPEPPTAVGAPEDED